MFLFLRRRGARGCFGRRLTRFARDRKRLWPRGQEGQCFQIGSGLAIVIPRAFGNRGLIFRFRVIDFYRCFDFIVCIRRVDSESSLPL